MSEITKKINYWSKTYSFASLGLGGGGAAVVDVDVGRVAGRVGGGVGDGVGGVFFGVTTDTEEGGVTLFVVPHIRGDSSDPSTQFLRPSQRNFLSMQAP